MSKIFISHSSRDNFEAQALANWLASEGWADIFLDLDPERGIAAGTRWEGELNKAAQHCEAVIFLISRNWLSSGWCNKELSLARGLNKKLFAVIIEPGLRNSDIPPEYAGTWQATDLCAGQDLKLFPTTLPGSHEEKHVAFSQAGLRRLKSGLEKAGLDPKFFAWPPASEPDRAPYRGLKPLEDADAGIFFGREAPIIEAMDRLRGLRRAAAPRLLVILGASGAGKSSFLRAGLMPRLDRDDRNFLPLPVIRPERAALYGDNGLLGALEKALPHLARADIRAAIEGGAETLRPLLAGLVAKRVESMLVEGEAEKPPAVVIAIDQAEELFRAEGSGEGTGLLALLRDLTSEDRPAVIAVFAVRSDAYDALEHAKPLEGLAQSTLPLLPVPRGTYKDVIEGPARRYVEAGHPLSIEPQLTQKLLQDLDQGGASDALPLLAFTLEQLFREYKGAGALELAHYEALGGLRGVIEAAVERAFMRADADPRIPRDRTAKLALLRRGLIPWLAGIDPETNQPRRRVALLSEIPVDTLPLIDALVEARLLSTDVDRTTGETTVEPAHEALLRQWGQLSGWLVEDLGALTTLEGVKRAATDWNANARSEYWLAHRSGRLEEADKQAARACFVNFLNTVERDYLAACRDRDAKEVAEVEVRRKEQEDIQARELRDAQRLAQAQTTSARRARFLMVAVTSAAILALAVVVFGFLARQAEQQAKEKSEFATFRQAWFLIISAQKKLQQNENTLAVLIALQAQKLWPEILSDTLFEAVRNNREIAVLGRHESPVAAAAFSPDGKLAVTAANEDLWLWDVGSDKKVLNRKLSNAGGDTHSFIGWSQFSIDGRWLMSIDASAARLWDPQTGNQVRSFPTHLAQFAPDGSRLLLLDGKRIESVDPHTGTILAILDDNAPPLISSAFSADGRFFAASDQNRTVRVWDVNSSQLVLSFKETAVVKRIALSTDGARIAGFDADARYFVRDNATNSVLADSRQQKVELATDPNTLVFSPDGERLLVAGWEPVANVWSFTAGRVTAFRGHQDSITSGTFSSDGKMVATSAEDGSARLWESETGDTIAILVDRLKPLPNKTIVKQIVFSTDNSKVLTTSDDGTVRIWRVAPPLDERVLLNLGASIHTAILSPDGRSIAALTDDDELRLADMTLAAPVRSVEGRWTAMAFDPSGDIVALGSEDGEICLLDVASKTVLADWSAADTRIDALAFSRDGKQLVDGVDDGSIAFWRTNGKTWSRSEKDFRLDGGVVKLAFDTEGSRLFAGGLFGQFLVLDVIGGRTLLTSPPPLPADQPINVTNFAKYSIRGQAISAVMFSSDGSKIFIGHGGGVTSYKINAPNEAAQFAVGPVQEVAEDDDRIVVMSGNGAVSIWKAEKANAPNASELNEFTRFTTAVSSAVDFKNNRYVFVRANGDVGVSNRIRKLDDLVAFAKAQKAREFTPFESAFSTW